MGWVEVRRPPHRCVKPFFLLGIGVGSVWSCDVCGKRWIVTAYTSAEGLPAKRLVAKL